MNGNVPTSKVTAYFLGASAAGLLGWYLRTKVAGWEDFPTEMAASFIGGVFGYFKNENRPS